MQKYSLVIADPPWSYNDQGTRLSPSYEGKQRKSGKRYDTMSLDEICALGEWVRWITEPNAILLLWSTQPIKETHPWPVIKAWGFRYSTAVPWIKARWSEKEQRYIYNQSGGHTVRSCSEELLVCVRGLVKGLVLDRSIPGAIIAPARPQHSAKPNDQYTIAERMVPSGHLEMFARNTRPGWDYWGDHWWWGSDLI